MVIAAKTAGVKRFIYASTSSVYGVSDAPDVTEDHPLVPLTLYNKFNTIIQTLQHPAYHKEVEHHLYNSLGLRLLKQQAVTL